MKPKVVIIFRILLLLYLAGLAYLCFGHIQNPPGIKWSYFGIPTDKIVHFSMFCPFPILLNWSIGRRPASGIAAIIITLIISVLGLMLAAGTEIGQSAFTTWRIGDVADFMADILAILFSSIIILISNIIRSCRDS